MRVMVIVKATKDSEAGTMPGPELLAAMGAFNEELARAGVMLDGAGLKASSHGVRVGVPAAGGERPVTHGPFKTAPGAPPELIAGYWIWQVKDLAEAIRWAQRCPSPSPGIDTHLEIRPVFEESDFA